MPVKKTGKKKVTAKKKAAAAKTKAKKTVKKAVAKKAPAKTAAKKTKTTGATKKSTTKKTTNKRTVAKKPMPKKTTAKKAASTKAAPKKAAPKKAAPKKAAPKKAAPKKAAPKAAPKKTAAKKVTAKRTTTRPTAKAARVTGASTVAARQGFSPYQPKRSEEYMNDEQTAHFRAILQAWKHELMEEVDKTVHHMQDEAANFPDPNDRATQESEFAMELRARDRERKLIKKIDESLDKLNTGDYGYCDVCGVEIGVRRLEARPTATQCIDCKTLDEIRERQMG